jgi:hypothetical protein
LIPLESPAISDLFGQGLDGPARMLTSLHRGGLSLFGLSFEFMPGVPGELTDRSLYLAFHILCIGIRVEFFMNRHEVSNNVILMRFQAEKG